MDFTAPSTGLYYVRVANANPAVFGEGTDYHFGIMTRWAGTVTSTIEGRIAEAGTMAPLADAIVQTSFGFSAISLPSGGYLLPHPPGAFDLTAKLAGYELFEESVAVAEGELMVKNIYLTPAAAAQGAPQVVGGTEDPLVEATVDTQRHGVLVVELSRRVPEGTRGKLFVGVQSLNHPALSQYVFFRPFDVPIPGGGYVQPVKDSTGYYADAADYFYDSGLLDPHAADLRFQVGTAGLAGLEFAFQTSYLEDQASGDMAGLRAIQRVEVEFQ